MQQVCRNVHAWPAKTHTGCVQNNTLLQLLHNTFVPRGYDNYYWQTFCKSIEEVASRKARVARYCAPNEKTKHLEPASRRQLCVGAW